MSYVRFVALIEGRRGKDGEATSALVQIASRNGCIPVVDDQLWSSRAVSWRVPDTVWPLRKELKMNFHFDGKGKAVRLTTPLADGPTYRLQAGRRHRLHGLRPVRHRRAGQWRTGPGGGTMRGMPPFGGFSSAFMFDADMSSKHRRRDYPVR